MRYDTKVILKKSVSDPVYDWETGNYSEGEPTEYIRWAAMADIGMEKRQVVFGNVDIRAYSLMFRHHLPVFDELFIDGVEYTVKTEKRFRHNTTLIVGEKQ